MHELELRELCHKIVSLESEGVIFNHVSKGVATRGVVIEPKGKEMYDNICPTCGQKIYDGRMVVVPTYRELNSFMSDLRECLFHNLKELLVDEHVERSDSNEQ